MLADVRNMIRPLRLGHSEANLALWPNFRRLILCESLSPLSPQFGACFHLECKHTVGDSTRKAATTTERQATIIATEVEVCRLLREPVPLSERGERQAAHITPIAQPRGRLVQHR